MKSLLDIQQDVRNLEGSVQEITKRIKALNSDIADIRNAEDDAEYDFQKIKLLARKIPFEEHPLSWLKSAGPGICQAYLELLLALVQLDPEEKTTVDRMVFIQWLQMKSGIVLSLDDFYKNALKIRQKIKDEYQEIFSRCDLILTPTAPTAAYKIGAQEEDPVKMYLADICTVPVNIAGLPAISTTCAYTNAGLPIGMSLVGKAFDEATILMAADRFERDFKRQEAAL